MTLLVLVQVLPVLASDGSSTGGALLGVEWSWELGSVHSPLSFVPDVLCDLAQITLSP